MITVYIYRSASCHRSVFHCFEDWKMSQKCTISTLQAIKNAIMGWSWPIDVNRNHLTIQKLNFWVYGTWRNSCKQMLFDNGIKWLGSLCIGLPKVQTVLFIHLPTAIVCNQHVSVFLRHTLLVEGKKTNLFEGYPSRRLRNNAAKQLTLPKAYLSQVLGGCSCVHHTPCTCTQVSIT